jgi:hypothetical protein
MNDEVVQDAAPSSTEPVPAPTPEPVVAPVVEAAPVAPAEPAPAPKTDMQLIEERFQVLEAAFLRLPHSIMTVMQRGSQAPEEFAAAVHAHLFSK